MTGGRRSREKKLISFELRAASYEPALSADRPVALYPERWFFTLGLGGWALGGLRRLLASDSSLLVYPPKRLAKEGFFSIVEPPDHTPQNQMRTHVVHR